MAETTKDTYQNLAANLGIGANNLAEQGRYLLTRFSWDYRTLNALYRNNWIAKMIIDKPANEMLKNWFEIQSQITPDQIDAIQDTWRKTKTRLKLLNALKWARLYGGSVLIPLIEGQDDLSKPLDYEEIMPDSYKGCYVVDRWSGVNPESELIDDISSPEFGKPKYYDVIDVSNNVVSKVHYSRLIRLIGRELPYWETLADTYWGASELEHVFEEIRKRDDTSANIAFLIFLANVRVYKSSNLGQLITIGDQEAATGVYRSIQALNRLMTNTGTLVIDNEDDFNMQQYTFTGINDVYESFMLDVAGAAEIPVDKLFGRSPNGFNSGEATLQSYYDNIQEKQETQLRYAVEKLNNIITVSTIGKLPDDIEIVFNPIMKPSAMDKADLAQKEAQPIFDAFDRGLINKEIVLKELKAQAPLTGLWTNITDEMIMEAHNEIEKEKAVEKDVDKDMDNEIKKMAEEQKNEETPKESNENDIKIEENSKKAFTK